MNFLAHLYLSGSNQQIMIGNFIADHIKGNKMEHFSKEIKQGVLLHREIDSFTDTHKIVRQSKRRLHERYGHYDGVIIDIFFDHFLAKNWHNYSAIPLKIYTQSVYKLFEKESKNLPEKSQNFIEYMIKYDILYHYKSLEGIQQVLNGMNKRTQEKSKMNIATEDLQNLYKEFEKDFTQFFIDLRRFSNQKLIDISPSNL